MEMDGYRDTKFLHDWVGRSSGTRSATHGHRPQATSQPAALDTEAVASQNFLRPLTIPFHRAGSPADGDGKMARGSGRAAPPQLDDILNGVVVGAGAYPLFAGRPNLGGRDNVMTHRSQG